MDAHKRLCVPQNPACAPRLVPPGPWCVSLLPPPGMDACRSRSLPAGQGLSRRGVLSTQSECAQGVSGALTCPLLRTPRLALREVSPGWDLPSSLSLLGAWRAGGLLPGPQFHHLGSGASLGSASRCASGGFTCGRRRLCAQCLARGDGSRAHADRTPAPSRTLSLLVSGFRLCTERAESMAVSWGGLGPGPRRSSF